MQILSRKLSVMQSKQTKFETDNNEFAKSGVLNIGFDPSEFHFLKKVKQKRNSLYLFKSFLAAVLKC